jgi:hypothetical protein
MKSSITEGARPFSAADALPETARGELGVVWTIWLV